MTYGTSWSQPRGESIHDARDVLVALAKETLLMPGMCGILLLVSSQRRLLVSFWVTLPTASFQGA